MELRVGKAEIGLL